MKKISVYLLVLISSAIFVQPVLAQDSSIWPYLTKRKMIASRTTTFEYKGWYCNGITKLDHVPYSVTCEGKVSTKQGKLTVKKGQEISCPHGPKKKYLLDCMLDIH